MSSHQFQTDIMLIPYDGAWVSWVPSVDVYSQGDSPEKAVMMAVDALRFITEHDMLNRDCTDTGFCHKRVEHPLRRGRLGHVSEDEHYQEWMDYAFKRVRWRSSIAAPIGQIGPHVGICFVGCRVQVICRGGVPLANVYADDRYIVAARAFDVMIDQGPLSGVDESLSSLGIVCSVPLHRVRDLTGDALVPFFQEVFSREGRHGTVTSVTPMNL